MDRVIRTGVVGLSGRGTYWARMYDAPGHPGFQLTAVCDVNPDRLAEGRALYGDRVRYYESADALAADEAVDAVLVATDDPHHVAPSLAGLRAGKHVLVEKPLCQSIDDARLLIAEARTAPGIFMIGFELRDCTVFQTMKRLLDEGRIGPVKVGHAFDNVAVGGRYFFHDPQSQKAYYKSLLLQKACHSLDLLNWFMDSEPVRVYGIGGQAVFGTGRNPAERCRDCPRADTCPYFIRSEVELDYGGVSRHSYDACVWRADLDLDDHSLLAITYANDAKATFHENHFTPEYSREFWLTGTAGKMYGYYDNPGRFLVRVEYAHDRERRTEEWKPPHTGGSHGGGDNRLRDEFYRRIVENDPPTEAHASAYYSTALALRAQESIDAGQALDIPPLNADGWQRQRQQQQNTNGTDANG